MDIIKVPINQLISDPINARKHPEKNIKALVGSLKKFGQQKPIVINKDNIVIAGNGFVEAAKKMGWKEIDCVVSELGRTDQTAYALADNRTAELAEWEDEVLGKTLQALMEDNFDIASIGFDPGEFDVSDPVKEGIEDDVPEIEENVRGVKRGEIYKLGEHRLMCGDSTLKEDVEKLMNGEKADMVFTDPPYNYGSETNCTKTNSGLNQLKNADWDKDFSPYKTPFFDFLKSDSVGYIFTSAFLFGEIFKLVKIWADFIGMLCWKKTTYNSNPIKKHPTWNIEPIVYFTKGNHIFNYDESEQKNALIEAATENYTNFVGHPSQKPVKMCEQIIKNSSNSGFVILDLFLGSGSTLIACEKTNRKCYGMEIDPHYCSVIIERWEKYSGKKAEKSTADLVK